MENHIVNYIDDDKTEMNVMMIIMMVIIVTMARAARNVRACFLELLRG